jgi:undecaprenyl-diphosphatase
MRGYFGLGALNQPILSWMISIRNPTATNIFQIITNLASPTILGCLVILGIAIWMYLGRELWRPLLLALALGSAALASFALKSLIMEARPPQIFMIPTFEVDFSFPSGHTLGVMVLFLVLGYLIYSRRFSIKRFVSWAVVAIFASGLIGVTRLYLGYHWLTDVIASVGLGLIILAAVIAVDSLASKYFKVKASSSNIDR